MSFVALIAFSSSFQILADHKQSYHDLAVRLEPIILELEREQNDVLIIAHESVLRVLYGYLMACGATDIPKLQFPRDEIIEIIPASYSNEARRVHIPGLPARLVPASPEDLKMPFPPSGAITPFSGLGTPAGTQTPVGDGIKPGGAQPADHVNVHPAQ